MNKITQRSAAGYWERISKATARKRYDSGLSVYLQSSNMMPDGPWQTAIQANNTGEQTFDALCASFAWYNCDSERGNYISFYTLTA